MTCVIIKNAVSELWLTSCLSCLQGRKSVASLKRPLREIFHLSLIFKCLIYLYRESSPHEWSTWDSRDDGWSYTVTTQAIATARNWGQDSVAEENTLRTQDFKKWGQKMPASLSLGTRACGTGKRHATCQGEKDKELSYPTEMSTNNDGGASYTSILWETNRGLIGLQIL